MGRWARLVRSGAIAQGVEHQFDPAGNAQFVEDTEEIILHCVFGELQTLCSLPIAKPFGDTSNYVELTGSEQETGVSVEIGESGLHQSFEDEVQLAATGPDLARVHALDALGEQAKGFGPAENALRSGTERFDYSAAVG